MLDYVINYSVTLSEVLEEQSKALVSFCEENKPLVNSGSETFLNFFIAKNVD